MEIKNIIFKKFFEFFTKFTFIDTRGLGKDIALKNSLTFDLI